MLAKLLQPSLWELQLGAALFGLLLLLLLILYANQLRKNQRDREPLLRPSTTLPFLQNTLDLVKNQANVNTWITEQCQLFQGKPWLLKSLGRPDVVVLCTPTAFEDIQKTQVECFTHGPYKVEFLRDFIGNGILLADGQSWIHQRNIAVHLFSARTLRESMTATIQLHAAKLDRILLDAAQQHKPVDIAKLMKRFTLQVFTEIGFGVRMDFLESEEEHSFERAFENATHITAKRFFMPTWIWKLQRLLDVGAEAELKRSMDVINKAAMDIITQSIERCGSDSNKPASPRSMQRDLISLFLSTKMDEETPKDVDSVVLRDFVINFLFAGRDTTANTLSWFFLCLSRHPEEARAVRAELNAKLPALSTRATLFPSMEDVHQLVYLEAALKETLRLFPAVPFNMKHAERDVVLSDGTFIPQGSFAAHPAYAMGRMANVWGPDAEDFKPSRWIDPTTGKLLTVSAFKFNSFLGGPRMCVGMNLALLEMKIVGAGLLSRFFLDLVPGQSVELEPSITLTPKGRLMMQPVL